MRANAVAWFSGEVLGLYLPAFEGLTPGDLSKPEQDPLNDPLLPPHSRTTNQGDLRTREETGTL